MGVGLAAALLWAAFQSAPGYMDSEYYYANALQIVRGQGFYEPFLWNYLADPGSLPGHAFTYWMPLPSLVAAVGMVLLGSESFFAARLIFILAAAFLPLPVMALAKKFTEDQSLIWTAGLLAVFSGFYTVFVSQTDSFILVMMLGCCFALAAFSSSNIFSRTWRWVLYFAVLGLLSGLFHLARADGLLWLGGSFFILFWRVIETRKESENEIRKVEIGKLFLGAFLVVVGYILITGWWYARNLSVWGTIMPPGGLSTIWLTTYDQTFTYPAEKLTFTNWLANGWKSIIDVRFDAFLQNIKTLIGVQLMVFLVPFILIGSWRFRKSPLIRFFTLMWLGIFTAMTVVFPFAGPRGGYLHSGSSVQPIIWALFPAGLKTFIQWGKRKRNWNSCLATRVFGAGFCAIAVMLSVVLFLSKAGIGNGEAEWEKSNNQYLRIDNKLDEYEVDPATIVMVNNPPGFFLASSRLSIVIPDGDVSTLLAAAERYGAEFLVLEENHPVGLNELFDNPGTIPELSLIDTVNGAQIYKILNLGNGEVK